MTVRQSRNVICPVASTGSPRAQSVTSCPKKEGLGSIVTVGEVGAFATVCGWLELLPR